MKSQSFFGLKDMIRLFGATINAVPQNKHSTVLMLNNDLQKFDSLLTVSNSSY